VHDQQCGIVEGAKWQLLRRTAGGW
jgi:hypothetical protein